MSRNVSLNATFLNDFTDHPDGIVWNASLVMLNYFKTKKNDFWRGKRVIELGSGLGHLAWGLYKLGAHVTCTDTPDGDLSALTARVQSWLAEEKSADSAGIGNEGRGSIRVQELTWGQQHWAVSPISTESVDYDVLILAEVFSLPELHEELVWTVQKLCHANIEIWSIFLNRSFSFMFFALLADAGGFRVRQIPGDEFDLLGMEGDELGIFMHQTFYDPSSPRVTRN